MKLSQYLKSRFRLLYPMVFFSISVGIVISAIDDLFFASRCVAKPIDLWRIILSYFLLHTGWIYEEGVMPYGSGVWFVCSLLKCYVIYWLISNKISEKNYILSLFSLFFAGWASSAGRINIVLIDGACLCFFGGAILYEFVYGALSGLVRMHVEKSKKTVVSWIIIALIGAALLLGKLSPDIFKFVICPLMIFYGAEIEWAKRILELRPFQIFGKLSMSIYLSHNHTLCISSILIVLFEINTKLTNKICFIVIMAFVFLVAIIWYYGVENKFVPFFNNKLKKIYMNW